VRTEPGRECSRQRWVPEISCPRDVSVGSDQHGPGRSDLAEDRELPHPIVAGVDQPDSIRPWRDVETAGFTKVQEHGPGLAQQGDDFDGRPAASVALRFAVVPFEWK
jgi:hypothetical protein